MAVEQLHKFAARLINLNLELDGLHGFGVSADVTSLLSAIPIICFLSGLIVAVAFSAVKRIR